MAVPQNVPAALANHFVDSFDARHVPDELLQVMKEKEALSLASRTQGGREGNGQELTEVQLRSCALRFFATVFRNRNADSWFDAVRIFDVDADSFSRCAEGGNVGDVLTCAAAVALTVLAKDEAVAATVIQQMLGRVSYMATELSQCVGGPLIAPEAVAAVQRNLLKTITSAPSAFTWVTCFVARLDVITNGRLEPFLSGIQQALVGIVWRVMFAVPTSSRMAPRTVALGTLALALGAASALPLAAVAGADAGTALREAALRALTPFVGTFPSSAVRGEVFFAALEYASYEKAASIREAATAVSEAVIQCFRLCAGASGQTASV